MESDITLHIHNGGEFADENGVKSYKGGKIELFYNQSFVSLPMFENYIRDDLGYKKFKIYWHKSGSLFNDYNCKFLWNDDSIEALCYYAMKNRKIDLYVDHSCDDEEVYDDDSSENDFDYKEESGESADDTKLSEDDSEDSNIDDYKENLSDCDDEFEEVMKKKCIHMRVTQLSLMMMI